MKTKAIYIKEWFKLKRYLLALVVVNLLLAAYFHFDLTGQYANIEPESMMWYRFSHLGNKPYAWLGYYFILVGAIVAVCQFVPEAMGKKVRILTHIPLPLGRVVFSHLMAGGLVILCVNAILGLGVVWSMSSFYPWEISHVTAKDMFFCQFPALAIYLGLAAVIIEGDWKRKAVKLAIACNR